MIRIALLIALLFLSSPAPAQPNTALGERVRITFRVGENTRALKVIGRLVQATSDSLAVDAEARNIAMPLSNVDRLEISRGQRSRTGTGALVGVLVGGGMVGMIAAANYEPCEGWCILHFSRGELFMTGALVGGLGGALVGVMIGSSVRVDDWEEVPLHASVSFTGTAPGLTLRFRF